MLFRIALRGRVKEIEEEMFFRREHSEAQLASGVNRQGRAKFAYATIIADWFCHGADVEGAHRLL